MPWFWPFSKNTPPVSTEPVAEPVVGTVATPIVMPVTKPVSTLLDNLVTTFSPCLPCKFFSFWKQNEPAVAALASEPVVLPVAEPVPVPLTSDSVTVVNESAALDSEILANPQLKIRPVEPA